MLGMLFMAIQTSVASKAPDGMPGLEYDSMDNDIVTKIAAEIIPFGVGVVFTAEQTCELPDATGEVTGQGGWGVALIDPNLPTGSTGYQIGDPVRVITRGRVWVLTEEALANTDPPFMRFASGGGGTQKGAFRNDADTATAVQAPNNARVFQGGSTGRAVLELR